MQDSYIQRTANLLISCQVVSVCIVQVSGKGEQHGEKCLRVRHRCLGCAVYVGGQLSKVLLGGSQLLCQLCNAEVGLRMECLHLLQMQSPFSSSLCCRIAGYIVHTGLQMIIKAES